MKKEDRDFAERLVEEVQQRKALYDVHEPGYRDKLFIESQWEAVGNTLNVPADAAKKRWQNLRGSFTKSVNKKLAADMPARKPYSNFYLQEKMSFLKDFLYMTPTLSSRSQDLTSVHFSQNESNSSQCADEEDDSTTDNKSFPLPVVETELAPSPSDEVRTETDLVRSPSLEGRIQTYEQSLIDREIASISSSNSLLLDANTPTNPVSQQRDSAHNQLSGAGASSILIPPSLGLSRSTSNSNKKKRNADPVERSILDFIKNRNKTDPDLEFFKGLLPQVKLLTSKRKRAFYQETVKTLFNLINEEEDENEECTIKTEPE